MVDNYAYAGVDFQGDTNMVLPNGEDFDDDLGKFFEFFKYISFFVVF